MAKDRKKRGNTEQRRQDQDKARMVADMVLKSPDELKGKTLSELRDYLTLLQQAGLTGSAEALLHIIRDKEESGEIVVNEGNAENSSAQDVLTINEGPDLEEREHPSDFKDNDWFRAYSNEIRTLLTNDVNEDEKQITEDDQGIHAPLKNGMVLHFVEQNHVQVATQEDPKPEDFKILVAFAKEQKKDIKLGDQMSDKFREALVVACAQENISITNLPAQYNELYNSHLPAQPESEQQAQELNDNEFQAQGDTPAEQQTQNNTPVAEQLVQSQQPSAEAQTHATATFAAQPVQTEQTSAVDDKDAIIAQLQAQVAGLKKQVSELTEIATDRVSDDDEDKDTIDGLRRQVRNLTEDLEKSKKENEELQAQLAAQQPAGENADLLEINNLVAQLRNEVAELKAQAKQAQEDHQRTLDALVKKDDSITALREQLAEANKTIEELKNNSASQVQEQVAEAPEPTVRNNAAAAATLASVVQGPQTAAATREATANAVAAEPETPVQEPEAVVETPAEEVQEPEAVVAEPEAQNQKPSVEYFVTPDEPAEEETPAPVEQVEQPAEPETPVQEPEAVVAEPETPVQEPEAVVAEPETPVQEPEAVVAEPETPVQEPEAVVAEPETPVQEPEAVVAEPETPVQGPDFVTPEEQHTSYEDDVNYDGPNGGSDGNGGDSDGTGGNGNNGGKRKKSWYKRWKNWAAAAVATAVALWGGTKIVANLSGASGDKKQNKTEKLADAPKSNVTVTDSIAAAKAKADSLARAQAAQAKADSLARAQVAQADSLAHAQAAKADSLAVATDAPTTWQEGMKVTPRQFTNMYDIELSHDKTGNLWKREWMNASDNETTFNLKPESLIFKVQRLQAWTNVVKGSTCDEHGGQWADANSGAFGDILGPLDQMLKCGEQMDSATIEKAKLLLSAVDDYGYLRKDVLLQLDPNIAKYNSFSADGRLRGTSRYYMTGTNDDCNNSMNEFKKGAAPRKAKVKYVRPAKEVVYEAPAEEPRQDMPAVDVEKRVDYTINTPVKAPKEQISVNVGASSNSSINMNATDMSQRATDVTTGATSFEYATTKTTQPMNKQELSESEKMAKKAAKSGVISEEEFLRVKRELKRELDQGR